jgi:hypothetical protein
MTAKDWERSVSFPDCSHSNSIFSASTSKPNGAAGVCLGRPIKAQPTHLPPPREPNRLANSGSKAHLIPGGGSKAPVRTNVMGLWVVAIRMKSGIGNPENVDGGYETPGMG